MKIGVLGGTFDPVHRGHVSAAMVAMRCADLDQVLLIPSAQPPHRGAAVAPAADRLAMANLAVGAEHGLGVSDVEIRRGGRSYTVDTLAELKLAHPNDELFLILGWDAARLFATWRRPDEIRRLASVVVVGRPGTSPPTEKDLTAAGLDPDRVVLCLDPTPDISGSALRSAIARGDSVADRLAPAVDQYISEHGLYRDNQDVGC